MVRGWVCAVSLVWVAGLLVGCGAPVNDPVSRTPTVSGPVVVGSPQVPVTEAPRPPGAALTATPPAIDLAIPLGETECPITGLEDYQACDGAFCVRAASMVTAVDERHKILWLPQNGFKGKLVVQAERYGGGDGLRQVLEDTLSPPEPDYPSVWKFPTAGCWRLTATAGEAVGRVVVWVR